MILILLQMVLLQPSKWRWWPRPWFVVLWTNQENSSSLTFYQRTKPWRRDKKISERWLCVVFLFFHKIMKRTNMACILVKNSKLRFKASLNFVLIYFGMYWLVGQGSDLMNNNSWLNCAQAWFNHFPFAWTVIQDKVYTV